MATSLLSVDDELFFTRAACIQAVEGGGGREGLVYIGREGVRDTAAKCYSPFLAGLRTISGGEQTEEGP